MSNDDIELNQISFRRGNGAIVCERVGDRWRYTAAIGKKSVHSDAVYIDHHCAMGNALIAMEKQHGLKFTKASVE